MTSWQQALGAVAVGLQLYSFLPYITGILRHKVKPHAFTWLIWSLLSGITFAAQLSGKAGAGAWMMGMNTLLCFVAALLAVRYGSRDIARSDWWALLIGLSAIPAWLLTHQPLGSVLIVCMIDLIAFWPTVRKSWAHPHDEAIETFLLGGVAAVISIAALAHFSLVTTLYPACLALMNFMFISMVALRRRFVND